VSAAASPGAGGGAARVRLVVREGCHLCADARGVLARVLPEGGWEELDVDAPSASPNFRAEHSDWVPVLLLDGAVHDRFRVDEDRLRRALEEPLPGRRRWRPW